jgi:hypothetical protein
LLPSSSSSPSPSLGVRHHGRGERGLGEGGLNGAGEGGHKGIAALGLKVERHSELRRDVVAIGDGSGQGLKNIKKCAGREKKNRVKNQVRKKYRKYKLKVY